MIETQHAGDVAFRVHPLTDVDAEELIASVKNPVVVWEAGRGALALDARIRLIRTR